MAIGPGKRAGPEPGCTKAGPHTNMEGDMDACDKCCARAVDTVLLDSGGMLTFCHHHMREIVGSDFDPGVDFTIIYGASEEV